MYKLYRIGDPLSMLPVLRCSSQHVIKWIFCSEFPSTTEYHYWYIYQAYFIPPTEPPGLVTLNFELTLFLLHEYSHVSVSTNPPRYFNNFFNIKQTKKTLKTRTYFC